MNLNFSILIILLTINCLIAQNCSFVSHEKIIGGDEHIIFSNPFTGNNSLSTIPPFHFRSNQIAYSYLQNNAITNYFYLPFYNQYVGGGILGQNPYCNAIINCPPAFSGSQLNYILFNLYNNQKNISNQLNDSLSIKNKIFVGNGTNGITNPILSPCLYSLRFYARPAPNVNYGIIDNSCRFNYSDYSFIDSFKIIALDINSNKLDSVFFGAPITLSDTSQWHRYSVQINLNSPLGGYFLIEPMMDNELKNSFLSSVNYDSIQNYFSNLNDTISYKFQMSQAYFFDSISLRPVNENDFYYCRLEDTSFCNLDTLFINAFNSEFMSYQWNTGDTTPFLKINSPGDYWLKAYYPCGFLIDSFTVFEEPANYLLPLSYADTLTICEQDLPLTLNAADTFATYLWSNGDTTFSSSFNQEGMVYLETEHFCGTLIDSVYLNVIETEILNINDTTICANQTNITINANPNFDTYLWSNGDTTASSSFDTAGIYWIQAFYLCDTLTDTFQVFEEPTLILNYTDTLTICETDLPIILQAADTFQNYSWSNGDTTFSSSVNQEGMIYLETQHFCGTLSDSVYLNVTETESLNINDTTICANQNIITINANPNFDNYLWSNSDTTASSSFDTAGIYWIQAFYLCDTLTDTFQVFEEPTLILNYADTLEFCVTDLPILLQAADTFQNYSWSNNATTFSSSFNQEGMVYLETQHFCGTLRDSVYLKLKDKENIDLIPFTDTLICASDLPFALQINDTLQNYLWSNGVTTFQNTFDAAGTYFVSADNGCHFYTDTFTLQTENLATGNFKHQNIYCPEDFPITLTAPSTLNPNWTTGENTNSITVNNAVNDVYIHNSFSQVCGNRTDSFFVYVLPDIITSLPQILIDDFCLEEGFYQFSTIVNDTNFVYQWENQTSLNFTTKGGTTQTLSISNACLSLEIDTFIERCPEQIAFALPTAFSPNNDGVNDVFQLLYLNPNYAFANLKIYNRWGELIFNSNDKTIGWNGVYKNKNAPIGNYIYHLELQNENLEIEIFKGNLSLIR